MRPQIMLDPSASDVQDFWEGQNVNLAGDEHEIEPASKRRKEEEPLDRQIRGVSNVWVEDDQQLMHTLFFWNDQFAKASGFSLL